MKKISYCLLFGIAVLHGCGSGSDGSPKNLTSQTGHSESPAPKRVTLGKVTPTIVVSSIKLPANRLFRPNAQVQKEINTIVKRTNEYRKAKGLPTLKLDDNLSAYASIRAREAAQKFAHQRPNGKRFSDPSVFKEWDVIGENIAGGKRTGDETATQWKKSPPHYKNMLGKDYTRIGVGYFYAPEEKYRFYWTQFFGGDKTQTIYDLITPIDANDVENAVGKRTRYNSKHQLTVSAPTHKGKQVIQLDGHSISLQPMNDHDWSYQTIGEVASDDGVPEAYVNVGQAFNPEKTSQLRAHYQGKAIGDVGQHSRTLADMSAEVDFNAKRKTLSLKLSNSKMSKGLSGAYHNKPNLDFSDQLTWNSTRQHFESRTGTARLYGDKAQELGGQFKRNVNRESYRGAYAGKRTK